MQASPLPAPSLTVIILTYNEQLHLERCIRSVQPVAERIIIVDSYSTDRTLEIAGMMGAEVFQNPFVHQAHQFQWALDNIPVSSDWIMRMDADEYIFPELASELQQKLPDLSPDITGLYIKRRHYFLDTWIRRGYYPLKLLRVWRTGVGYIQQKWMDEHALLKHGESILLQHDMADHNLNHLGWWTDKHNKYAMREAIERLNLEYHFLGDDPNSAYSVGKANKWYKSAYLRLPLFLRPFMYFFYRYFIRLGFLEGRPALIWHILQGFWYQFLVDAKIYQIKHIARTTGRSVKDILSADFGVKL